MEEDSLWEEKPPSVMVGLRIALCAPFVGAAIVTLLELANETDFFKALKRVL